MLAYYFERAARIQLKAQAAAAASGGGLALPPPEVSEKAARQFTEFAGDIRRPGFREWPGFLRLLEDVAPGYAD